jgi:hypothetical protein
MWTNHLCISHQTYISPPSLSVSYQNQTRAFQSLLFLVIDDNFTKIWKLSSYQVSTSHKCKLLTWFRFYVTYPTMIKTICWDLGKHHKTRIGNDNFPYMHVQMVWFQALHTCINIKFVWVLSLLSGIQDRNLPLYRVYHFSNHP